MTEQDFNPTEFKEFCKKVADDLRKNGVLQPRDNEVKTYHPFTYKP